MSRGSALAAFVVFLACACALVAIASTFHGLADRTQYEPDWSWDRAYGYPHPYKELLERLGWGGWALCGFAFLQILLLGYAMSRAVAARRTDPGEISTRRRIGGQALVSALWLERLGLLALLVGVARTGHGLFTGCRKLLLVYNNMTPADLDHVVLPVVTILPAAAALFVIGIVFSQALRFLTPRVDVVGDQA